MVLNEIAPGQQSSWSLLKKLGEGDAGEVFLVESLLERKAAILKRPHRSAFSSDIIRQASQIETEGKILRSLSSLRLSDGGLRIKTPAVLDGAVAGTEFSERYFIVIEQASGFDLSGLARIAHFGLPDPERQERNGSSSEEFFLKNLALLDRLPTLVLLRALWAVIELFEKIHSFRVVGEDGEKAGLVWNDVKPEHLFWDPIQRQITIIDWGNSQFLEGDGATKDRLYSRLDDYAQFVQEMGKFVSDTDPELYASLEWPANLPLVDAYPEAVRGLKNRISDRVFEALEGLRNARQEEEILSLSPAPTLEQLPELEHYQEQIIGYGELPDFSGGERFAVRLGIRLATENRLEDFISLCNRMSGVPVMDRDKWLVLARLGELASQNSGGWRQTFSHALVAGLSDDWAGVLWDLISSLGDGQAPLWFEDLVSRARQLQLGDSGDGLTPFVVVSRLSYTLQANLQKLEPTGPERLQEYSALARALREEVVRKWNQVEPDPPDAGLEYGDLDRLLAGIGELLPDALPGLARVLNQPKAQVGLILEAWNRKDFEAARRGLRNLLLWDPDRRRLFTAERAILSASAWLEKVYLGPKKGEAIQDFLASAELAGRELRNAVGPARWLDLILEAFSRLRKGAAPSELIAERPELLNEIFWLNDYESRRPAVPPRDAPIRLERELNAATAESTASGIQEGRLGGEEDLILAESLDTWAPEARGSSARVFLGFLRMRTGQLRQGAIKMMRPDRAEYALPLFREEIQILTLMRDVPGVSGLVECGFIHLEEGAELPAEDRPASARHLFGNVLRYGIPEIRDFLAALETKISAGWLPYLATERRNREDNLMVLCDAGYNHGRFLPVDESLRFSIQICDILQAAHARNIVYRDHKILHYYWLEPFNGVFVIDWNVAKRHPQGLTNADRQFDLVQFGARALHHILTGRPAPGALPLGPTRPEEIEQAAHSYKVHWTYDDRRLPVEIRGILEAVLAGNYDSVKQLRDDLYASFLKISNGNLVT